VSRSDALPSIISRPRDPNMNGSSDAPRKPSYEEDLWDQLSSIY